MPAGIYDFEVEQGATFKRSFLYSNKATDIPYDITGCKIRMQVRKAQQQPVLLKPPQKMVSLPLQMDRVGSSIWPYLRRILRR